jgi:hypothetical protein
MKRPLGLVLVMLGACAEPSGGAPPDRRGTLRAGVVARVGDAEIASDTVARIALAQGVTAPEALDRAVRDALLAAGARSGLGAGELASIESRVLARAVLRALWQEAQGAPIGDAELADATDRQFIWYDRPRGFRTLHAVVEVDEAAPAELGERARALADAIAAAVAPVAEQARATSAPERSEEQMFGPEGPRDPVEQPFRDAVASVDRAGLTVTVEALPPATAEGRLMAVGSDIGLDPAYARAAAELTRRGELSGVARSAVGFHVILLLEITPEKRVPADERRAVLRDDIHRRRASDARRELLERLRAEGRVAIEARADALLDLLRVEAPAP